MNTSLRNWISWFVGGLLLCAMAFHNGFPLHYPDTDTYIECGFRGEQWVYGRPMAYALFIRHASLSASLWYVVLAQGFLLSSLMLLTLRHFLPRSVRPQADLIHVGLILLLVLCTGISVRCSQLMPDIFTPIAALGLLLVLLAREQGWLERVYVSVVTVWALASHTSHLASFLLLMGGLSLWWSIYWWRTRRLPIQAKRWLWGGLLVGSAWLLVPTLNYTHKAPFSLSESSSLFFFGKLSDMGIVPLFLRNRCKDDSTYFLCDYRGKLPRPFLWDPKSPIFQMGGWEQVDQAPYKELTQTILAEPKYLKLYVQGVITGAIKQFFNFTTANIYMVPHLGTPWIYKRFYHEANLFPDTLQWKGKLDLSAINARQNWLVYASFFVIMGFILRPAWRHRLTPELQWALVIVVGLLITNAGVCGGLSNGTMRYQNRVIWLLPFVLAIAGMAPLQHFLRQARTRLFPPSDRQ